MPNKITSRAVDTLRRVTGPGAERARKRMRAEKRSL